MTMSQAGESIPFRRVLLVEDHSDSAEMLRVVLELNGHEVEVAPDAASALGTLRDRGADVVLCDLGLPHGLSGYDFAREVRKDAALQGLPLVALTGYGQRRDRDRSDAAGFDAHLTKPVETATIEEVFRDLAQRVGAP